MKWDQGPFLHVRPCTLRISKITVHDINWFEKRFRENYDWQNERCRLKLREMSCMSTALVPWAHGFLVVIRNLKLYHNTCFDDVYNKMYPPPQELYSWLCDLMEEGWKSKQDPIPCCLGRKAGGGGGRAVPVYNGIETPYTFWLVPAPAHSHTRMYTHTHTHTHTHTRLRTLPSLVLLAGSLIGEIWTVRYTHAKRHFDIFYRKRRCPLNAMNIHSTYPYETSKNTSTN